MAGIKIYEFDNSDLTDYVYTLNHMLGTINVALIWIDDVGAVRNAPDLFTIVDENTVTLNVETDITGTHKILLMYDNIIALSGRKLFTLPELDTNIDNDYRIALGKDGFLAGNMQLSDFYTMISTRANLLTFAKIQNDTSLQTALRLALNVYSQSSTNTLFTRRYASGVVGALATDNTVSYTPTSPFNPSTKDYVDTGGLRISGTVNAVDRHSSITGADVLYFARRSGWANLNVKITANAGTNTTFRIVGNVSFLPQSEVEGHGFRYRQSNIIETCPWRINENGRLEVIPYAAGEWLLNINYPVKVT